MPENKQPENSNPERDFNPPKFNQLPKEEIILLLKKTAKQLGRVPTFLQFRRLAGATPRPIGRLFGGYGELIRRLDLSRWAQGTGSPWTSFLPIGRE